jgi:peptide methionine sulfoxide reductase msrA/msrB
MTIASAFLGLYRQPMRTLLVVIQTAMLLLSCQADAQQNIIRNNMKKENLKEIYLAGGCFWGTEHYFKQIDGVVDTEVGYANGTTENPTYKDVCTDKTGFAETVHVTYNPDKVSLKFLLEMYFKAIDPTSINRQGHDTGTQYRTGVYYTDSTDEATISKVFDEEQKHIQGKIAVENLPLKNFYKAEDYHQDYLDKNPDGYCHLPQSLFEFARKAKDNHADQQ